MRTSTGSISVTKIIQNARLRNGKRKYTIANADNSDMTILPTAMTSALMRLLTIIRPTPAPADSPAPCASTAW